MRPPRFSLCPSAHKKVCLIGALPPNQAFELIVKSRVGQAVAAGEQVTLTVTVQATALSPAEASVTAQVGQTSSPTPVATAPLPTLPPAAFPPLPGPVVSPTSLSSLFPVVTPSSTPSPTARQRSRHDAASIRPTASTLPLDPRLIGGQLAGLAVLAAAITMVVARLSLRTPQSPADPAAQGRSGSTDST